RCRTASISLPVLASTIMKGMVSAPNSSRPGKAGTHLSEFRATDEWVPAFAGTQILWMRYSKRMSVAETRSQEEPNEAQHRSDPDDACRQPAAARRSASADLAKAAGPPG